MRNHEVGALISPITIGENGRYNIDTTLYSFAWGFAHQQTQLTVTNEPPSNTTNGKGSHGLDELQHWHPNGLTVCWMFSKLSSMISENIGIIMFNMIRNI